MKFSPAKYTLSPTILPGLLTRAFVTCSIIILQATNAGVGRPGNEAIYESSHSYRYEQPVRLCNNCDLPPAERFSQLCHGHSHVCVDRHGTEEAPELPPVVQSQ